MSYSKYWYDPFLVITFKASKVLIFSLSFTKSLLLYYSMLIDNSVVFSDFYQQICKYV